MTAEFIEVKPEFGWHTGMLIPGTTMQISFLKDLVTQRNPQSEFTFLNYLTERGRLTEFINYKTFFPTRLEFHDYLAWAADKVDATVRYGSRVTAIREVDGAFEVEVTGTHAGRLRARNVVIAGGLEPQLPPGVTRSAARSTTTDCCTTWSGCRPATTTDSSSSAPGRVPRRCAPTCTTSRRRRCTASSRSTATAPPTTARSPTGSSTPRRSTTSTPPTRACGRQLIDYHRSTNYSAVDLPLDRGPLRPRVRRTGRRQPAAVPSRRLQHLRHRRGRRGRAGRHPAPPHRRHRPRSTATQSSTPPASCRHRCAEFSATSTTTWCWTRTATGGVARLPARHHTADCGGLYIQGNTEHTHGLTSSLLSNIAVRSAEILQSIEANRLSPVGDASR